MPTASLELEDCQEVTQTVAIDDDIDLLDADSIVLPAGTWCAAKLIPDGALTIEATRAGGGVVDLTVDVAAIPLDLPGSVTVDATTTGSAVVLFEAGWFAELAGGSASSEDVTVVYGDPEHGEMAVALTTDSVLLP